MTTTELMDRLRRLDDCQVLAPSGIPAVGLPLPPDIEEFYRLCGGATLFEHGSYTIDIIGPEHFVRANPVIVGEDVADDISHDWFVIAKAGDQYITIDLNQSRIGRCYDSFWDRHGIVGECPIIATSFERLLEQLIEAAGEYWYWLQDEFTNLGDAYDESL